METWDVYDARGKCTGKICTRNDVFHAGEYHLGSALWIVNSQGKLLIQKRAATKRINPNKWAITCGAVKAGETSMQGCLREVEEEIGLKLDAQNIAFLSRKFGRDLISDDYVTVLDFPLSDAVLQVDEVSEIKWASIEEIKVLFDEKSFMMNDMFDMEKVIEYMNELGIISK